VEIGRELSDVLHFCSPMPNEAKASVAHGTVKVGPRVAEVDARAMFPDSAENVLDDVCRCVKRSDVVVGKSDEVGVFASNQRIESRLVCARSATNVGREPAFLGGAILALLLPSCLMGRCTVESH
jgi:hypothetical protein